MRNRVPLNRNLIRSGFLTVATMAALAGPIIIGIVNVKASEAQSESTELLPVGRQRQVR